MQKLNSLNSRLFFIALIYTSTYNYYSLIPNVLQSHKPVIEPNIIIIAKLDKVCVLPCSVKIAIC